mmetsp:Transcript_6016/g.18087  ORF Transcript_6016/g.18087 Transcript_6016/m.18087 type:complete len:206 (+) Transcript_6016:468-1085(+)
MPSCSYVLPTIKPVIFCRKTSGMPRCEHSWMKCEPLSAESGKSAPLLATMPTLRPSMVAKAVTSVVPYSALNSCTEPPSTTRSMISRTSYACFRSAGTTVPSSSSAGSLAGGAKLSAPAARAASPRAALVPRVALATHLRASASACSSLTARWSATPEMRQCTSPPPSSSAVTTSPVAASTSGGPPRKIVPWFCTMMDSSAMAGT